MNSKKFISIDLEFNKKYQPLSFGYQDNNDKFNEFYFKNETDFFSYKVHGIPNYFLSKYGKYFHKEKENIISNILSYQYIVGFNIINDFKSLKIKNFYNLYKSKRVIDIESIINLFGINISLFKLYKSFNVKVRLKGVTAHNALFDSIATNQILKIIIKSMVKNGIPEDEILEDFARMTYLIYDKKNEEKDIKEFVVKYNDILLNFTKLTSYNEIDETIHFYHKSKHFSLFFNKHKEVIYKIPNDFIKNEAYTFKENNIKIQENLFIGYRFPVNDNINSFIVKENLKRWSFF